MHPTWGQIAKFSAKLVGSLALSSIRRFRDAYVLSRGTSFAHSSSLLSTLPMENVTHRGNVNSPHFHHSIASHSLFSCSFHVIRDPSRFEPLKGSGTEEENLMASLRDTRRYKIANCRGSILKRKLQRSSRFPLFACFPVPHTSKRSTSVFVRFFRNWHRTLVFICSFGVSTRSFWFRAAALYRSCEFKNNEPILRRPKMTEWLIDRLIVQTGQRSLDNNAVTQSAILPRYTILNRPDSQWRGKKWWKLAWCTGGPRISKDGSHGGRDSCDRETSISGLWYRRAISNNLRHYLESLSSFIYIAGSTTCRVAFSVLFTLCSHRGDNFYEVRYSRYVC